MTAPGRQPDKAEDWKASELNAMVRKLQPHILINNRSGTPEDFDTAEQQYRASSVTRGKRHERSEGIQGSADGPQGLAGDGRRVSWSSMQATGTPQLFIAEI